MPWKVAFLVGDPWFYAQNKLATGLGGCTDQSADVLNQEGRQSAAHSSTSFVPLTLPNFPEKDFFFLPAHISANHISCVCVYHFSSTDGAIAHLREQSFLRCNWSGTVINTTSEILIIFSISYGDYFPCSTSLSIYPALSPVPIWVCIRKDVTGAMLRITSIKVIWYFLHSLHW